MSNIELNDEDGECYSEYEEHLKPIVKRGTFEQFLAVYVPSHMDDDFYFMLACEYNRLDMAQHIYNNVSDINLDGEEEDINALSLAIKEGNLDVVRWLLTLDGITVQDKLVGDAPLVNYAVNSDFPSDIIMRLIDLGARPRGCESDSYPLFDSLERNRFDIAEYLVMHGFVCPTDLSGFDLHMSSEAWSFLDNYSSSMLR